MHAAVLLMLTGFRQEACYSWLAVLSVQSSEHSCAHVTIACCCHQQRSRLQALPEAAVGLACS